MTKISMAAAAKEFAVSRPTLLKHLQQGKISGEKVTKDKNEYWQIDVSELSRVYERRVNATPEKHDEVTNFGTPDSPDLQAEIRVLQAKLEAAEKLAEERKLHLDDLRKLLTGPQDHAPRRRWWPFGSG